jgi:hypothetical protein
MPNRVGNRSLVMPFRKWGRVRGRGSDRAAQKYFEVRSVVGQEDTVTLFMSSSIPS